MLDSINMHSTVDDFTCRDSVYSPQSETSCACVYKQVVIQPIYPPFIYLFVYVSCVSLSHAIIHLSVSQRVYHETKENNNQAKNCNQAFNQIVNGPQRRLLFLTTLQYIRYQPMNTEWKLPGVLWLLHIDIVNTLTARAKRTQRLYFEQ